MDAEFKILQERRPSRNRELGISTRTASLAQRDLKEIGTMEDFAVELSRTST